MRWAAPSSSLGGSYPGIMASSAAIEQTILELLARRTVDATICPSEAARALWPAPAWRERMDEVRAVAFALADAGELEITQHGEVVDGRSARGPIRLRRLS